MTGRTSRPAPEDGLLSGADYSAVYGSEGLRRRRRPRLYLTNREVADTVPESRPATSLTGPLAAMNSPDAMFEAVAIVGVGLLGGSLGMALRDRGLAQRVIGIPAPPGDHRGGA